MGVWSTDPTSTATRPEHAYEEFFRRFGGFLIFVAAVTPLPYSAVCLLVGSVNFKFRNFLLISSTRFLRFAVYSYILWEAGSVTL